MSFSRISSSPPLVLGRHRRARASHPTRPTRLGPLPRIVAVGLALALLVLAGLGATDPASAVTTSGRGLGYTWRVDGFSWLGTYTMADGRAGFCLEAGKRSPVGNDYSTASTDLISGTTPEGTAQLAYIARTWAATTDRDDAAAAQLAVWTITGLNGHDQAYYAARANERAAIVLARAQAMLREAAEQATVEVRAALTLDLDDSGSAAFAVDLVAARPDGAPTPVDPGSYRGSVSLTGAAFADGSPVGTVTNGTRVEITPVLADLETSVHAETAFRGLPFGRSVLMGSSPAGSQKLLFSSGGLADAAASASAKALSPLPFQPFVSTQTSSYESQAGAELTDALEVTTKPGDGALSEWGVYRDGERYAPIPVTVRSRLLGPFRDPIAPADEWPAEAPTVCEVTTLFEAGPDSGVTPPCTIPAAGYYVWVETIDPADTAIELGGDRITPWRSPFGQATEVTFTPARPVVTTSVVESTVTAGSCAVDELTATGFGAPDSPITTDVEIDSTLIGPLAERPVDGDDLTEGLDGLPVAARVTTVVHGDGSYRTACVTVAEPGHYVFVLHSPGSDADSAGRQAVPAFADLVVHDSETFEVVAEPQPAGVLAFTGLDGARAPFLTALGAITVGVTTLLAMVIVRRMRRRRNAGSAQTRL